MMNKALQQHSSLQSWIQGTTRPIVDSSKTWEYMIDFQPISRRIMTSIDPCPMKISSTWINLRLKFQNRRVHLCMLARCIATCLHVKETKERWWRRCWRCIRTHWSRLHQRLGNSSNDYRNRHNWSWRILHRQPQRTPERSSRTTISLWLMLKIRVISRGKRKRRSTKYSKGEKISKSKRKLSR